MGYTHYWAFDPHAHEVGEGFVRTAADAARIIAVAGVPLTLDGEEPTQPPEATPEHIWLNGTGEDAWEPFVLARDPARFARADERQEAAEQGYWWSFCKTNWQPYDLVVCAILIRAHQHMPGAFVFESDGAWEDDNWRAAREFIARTSGADAVPSQDPMSRTDKGPSSTARR